MCSESLPPKHEQEDEQLRDNWCRANHINFRLPFVWSYHSKVGRISALRIELDTPVSRKKLIEFDDETGVTSEEVDDAFDNARSVDSIAKRKEKNQLWQKG
jgi:hypothetical protein